MIKEKVNNFIAAFCKEFGADADNIEFLESRLDTFRIYVNAVTSMEYRIPILKFKMEGESLRDVIMELDKSRKICHDNAIATCSAFNRISEQLGLEPFFEGDTNDRHQVAEFAGEFVNELYQQGISPCRNSIPQNEIIRSLQFVKEFEEANER